MAQLKATYHLSFFPNRLMPAVDIMWYMTLDDQVHYDELCRNETDFLCAEERSSIRQDWHEFIVCLCKQTAVRHVRRCWDDEFKAVSTWNTFRNELIESANREWQLKRARIKRKYWKHRFLSVFDLSKRRCKSVKLR
jgi:hypothetical protein